MSIPKIIHYCWFGGKSKPDNILKYMKTWDRLKGYEIIEWNEQNFDVHSNPYVKEAYENRKFAFVSDYVRLNALYNYGGIYLDTDIEVKKSFDPFLEHRMFIGFMYDCLLGTAVIGAEKEHPAIKGLLDNYHGMEFKSSPNNNLYTRHFLNTFPDFKLNNQNQVLEHGVSVFAKEYFERPTYNKQMGFTVHHYAASWKEKNKTKELVKNTFRSVIGEVFYGHLSHRSALLKNPFYDTYLKHKSL